MFLSALAEIYKFCSEKCTKHKHHYRFYQRLYIISVKTIIQIFVCEFVSIPIYLTLFSNHFSRLLCIRACRQPWRFPQSVSNYQSSIALRVKCKNNSNHPIFVVPLRVRRKWDGYGLSNTLSNFECLTILISTFGDFTFSFKTMLFFFSYVNS